MKRKPVASSSTGKKSKAPSLQELEDQLGLLLLLLQHNIDKVLRHKRSR